MSVSQSSTSTNLTADYGIDAPGVIRNLTIIGIVAWLAWGCATLDILPPVLTLPLPGISLSFPIAAMGWKFGILLLGIAGWMVWDSKIGKMSRRDKILAQITWTGQERVLDVGCGRGLLLIGAAKRLTTGKATGVDIWNSEDLSDNRADATLENARREGVADRIELETADMRKLPFADNSFDVIVSRAAIHNVYNRNDRATVIAELSRVLKPGGTAVIEDIRYITEYAKDFKSNGLKDVNRIDALWASALTTLVTVTSLRPGTLLVRKAK